MSGIDPKVTLHHLNIDDFVKLVKQKKRTFSIEKNRAIKEEINKL